VAQLWWGFRDQRRERKGDVVELSVVSFQIFSSAKSFFGFSPRWGLSSTLYVAIGW
jgi:hypothetical protein